MPVWLRKLVFFSCIFAQFAEASKKRSKAVHPLEKSVINMIWLLILVFDWPIIMIRPGGLLLVVPTYLQSLFHFYWWGCKKVNSLNLDVRNIFARSNTEHLWECWYVIEYIVIWFRRERWLQNGGRVLVGGEWTQMFRVEGAHSHTYHGCVPEKFRSASQGCNWGFFLCTCILQLSS
jgi:hypothetical protein